MAGPIKKIGKLEWGMLYGIALLVDAVQIALDAFAVGLAANRFIDIAFATFLLLYCHLRNIKLTFKTLTSITVVFILEEIPIVDALPFWTGDIWFIKKDRQNQERAAEKEAEAKRLAQEQLDAEEYMRLEQETQNTTELDFERRDAESDDERMSA